MLHSFIKNDFVRISFRYAAPADLNYLTIRECFSKASLFKSQLKTFLCDL